MEEALKKSEDESDAAALFGAIEVFSVSCGRKIVGMTYRARG